MNRWGYPDLGFGVGLRSVHYNHVLKNTPAVDWFEVISENYMAGGSRARYVLECISERYPVVLHGVSLSIGSTDPLDFEYLKTLKDLARTVNPRWISDHLCWTGVAGRNLHQLLPMPFTAETLRHTRQRLSVVQDFLERPVVLENASTYLEFKQSDCSEPEFLSTLAQEADCGLLVDVNNVYVNAFNHDFDAKAYIDVLPADRVVQMHLAGHRHRGTHIVDSHDGVVTDPVWDLYRYASQRFGKVSTLIEWDDAIPAFHVVHAEAQKARAFCGDV